MALLIRMLELWSNFVKYGDPTPGGGGSENLGELVWRPVQAGDHQYLRWVVWCAAVALASSHHRIDRELGMEMTEEYLERLGPVIFMFL